jgi:hypothetical protein
MKYENEIKKRAYKEKRKKLKKQERKNTLTCEI